MKKVLAVFFVTSVTVALLSGCINFKKTPPTESESNSQEPQKSTSSDVSKPEPPSSAPKPPSPDDAAEKLLQDIINFNDDEVKVFAEEYFSMQTIPDEYYSILKPIAKRVTYKVGSCKIDGDKAAVDVAVTSVDAQAALNNAILGALMHLAVMQMSGKDISNPEKVIIEYATNNIDWDKLPTIKTNTTLYLVRGADGEWKADASNPDNLKFVNAISGGAIDVAQNLTSLAEKYK